MRRMGKLVTVAALLVGGLIGLVAPASAAGSRAGDTGPAAISPGIYKVINVASGTSVRSYQHGDVLSVSYANSGPFELWQVAESPDGTFTISNVGLSAYATSGEYVTCGDEPTSWDIVPTNGGDQYSVKLPGQDLFWTAAFPVIGSSVIGLNPGSGGDAQQFTFVRIDNT